MTPEVIVRVQFPSSGLRLLEQDYDRRAEEAIPSADDLGAQFEQFLRDHRNDD